MKLETYRIIVMNLNSRGDRWEEISDELDRMNLRPYFRFASHTGGLEGYNRTYLDCMRFNGNMFLFEDDTMFTDGARDILDKAIAQLPDDFDMIYLGGNVLEPIQRYSDNLYRAYRGVHCTHAVLWSDAGRRKFLKYYPPEKQEGQLFDNWIFERGQSLMNCYVISPLIAFQRPSYSDVSNTYSDYVQEMKEHEKQNML